MSIVNTPLQSEKWVDRAAYPFESKYIQLGAGKMHYVDEGAGETILFVHGTPTWSFLYRAHIAHFSKKYRCIAPDQIGFGLSEKPAHFEGTPQAHSQNLSEFIEQLDLKDIPLVVHDFGGPIGLSAAIQNPQRFKRIVLFNTWLWETKSNPNALKVDKILNSALGRFLYLRMNFSPKVLLKKGFHDKSQLTRKIHRQYTAPFPNKGSRHALLAIGKSLVGASDWYQEQWEKVGQLEGIPRLILWGTKDGFITVEHLEKWRSRWPEVKVKEYDCGHFVQEEKTAETIREMESFMSM